jgi:hypothetical protein
MLTSGRPRRRYTTAPDHRGQHDREVAEVPHDHEPDPRVLGVAAARDERDEEDGQVRAEHGQEGAHPLPGADLIWARHSSTVSIDGTEPRGDTEPRG